MQFTNTVSPDRLLQAADAALLVARETARRRGGTSPHPAILKGSPNQHAILKQFTQTELHEACDFLVRLGFMQTLSK